MDQKETIVKCDWIWDIQEKPNQSGGSQHNKEKVNSLKGGLLILDTMLIVVRVLKNLRV